MNEETKGKIHTGTLSVRANSAFPKNNTDVRVDYMSFGSDLDALMLSVKEKLKNGEEVLVTFETDEVVEKHNVVLSD